MSLTAVPKRRKQSLWKRFSASKMLLLMCLPAIAFFVIFNSARLLRFDEQSDATG